MKDQAMTPPDPVTPEEMIQHADRLRLAADPRLWEAAKALRYAAGVIGGMPKLADGQRWMLGKPAWIVYGTKLIGTVDVRMRHGIEVIFDTYDDDTDETTERSVPIEQGYSTQESARAAAIAQQAKRCGDEEHAAALAAQQREKEDG